MKNKSIKPNPKPPTKEKLIATHLGMTVSDYRGLRASANKHKKFARDGIVLELFLSGYTYRQIAQVMEITEATVRNILK